MRTTIGMPQPGRYTRNSFRRYAYEGTSLVNNALNELRLQVYWFQPVFPLKWLYRIRWFYVWLQCNCEAKSGHLWEWFGRRIILNWAAAHASRGQLVDFGWVSFGETVIELDEADKLWATQKQKTSEKKAKIELEFEWKRSDSHIVRMNMFAFDILCTFCMRSGRNTTSSVGICDTVSIFVRGWAIVVLIRR